MGTRPDKGFAWVVLVAAFICQATTIGFSVGCIGVTTLSFAKMFPNASSSDLSWIGSLRGSCQFLASLIAMPLAEKYGFRVVTICGTLIAAAGVTASIFATEMWHVYVGFGIIGGVGISSPFSTSMAILGDYFHRLKHIAFPVVGFGQAAGILAFPPMLQEVVDSFGHVNALIFTACIISINAFCGIFFKAASGNFCDGCYTPPCCSSLEGTPVTAEDIQMDGGNALSSDSKVPCSESSEVSSQDALCCKTPGAVSPPASSLSLGARLEKCDGENLPSTEFFSHLAETEEDEDEAPRGVAPSAAEMALGVNSSDPPEDGSILKLLKRWEVWAHILNPFLWGTCTSATEALWPLLATRHGISDASAALGVTMSGVGFLLASVVITATGKRPYDRYLLYLLAAAFCGLFVLIAPQIPMLEPSYITIFSLYGWWLGVLLSLFMSVLSDCVGPKDFAGVIALYNFMNGVGYFVGPILIGTLETNYGEVAGWTVCGCFSITASLIIIQPYVVFRRRLKAAAAEADTLPGKSNEPSNAPPVTG